MVYKNKRKKLKDTPLCLGKSSMTVLAGMTALSGVLGSAGPMTVFAEEVETSTVKGESTDSTASPATTTDSGNQKDTATEEKATSVTDSKMDELKEIAGIKTEATDTATEEKQVTETEVMPDFKITMDDEKENQVGDIVESLAKKVNTDTLKAISSVDKTTTTLSANGEKETGKLTNAVKKTSETSIIGQTLSSVKEVKESVTGSKTDSKKKDTFQKLNTKKSFSYLYDDYLVQMKDLDVNKSGYQDATVEIRQLSATEKQMLTLASSSEKADTDKAISGLNKSGVMSETVKVQMIDTSAPVVTLNDTDRNIKVGNGFDVKNYITSVTDKEDGELEYTVEGNVDTNTEGSYTVNIVAKDKAGNETKQPLTVNVQKDTPAPAVVQQQRPVETVSGQASGGEFYDRIANAALAQLGVGQDCTALVSNSLRAVGINFHGWPYQYMQLGQLTNNPVPGDICVYNGHVAIYVGNGMAVHGGWYGWGTVKYSVACGNAFIGYVHVTNGN